MDKWEYLFVVIKFSVKHDSDLEERDVKNGAFSIEGVNALGAEGWELVNTDGSGLDYKYTRGFFKRKKSDTVQITEAPTAHLDAYATKRLNSQS